MGKSHSPPKSKKVVVVNRQRVEVWPSDQKVGSYLGPETNIAITRFDGMEDMHTALVSKILELENHPRFGEKRQRGGCGNKVSHVRLWECREADLIHARAISLFTQVLGCPNGVVDDSWASIYRHGDYCMPHSHLRCTASLVYMLDLGDSDPEHALSGRLYFADPRVRVSCNVEGDRMTRILIPDLQEGFMVMFPSAMVHGVNPYTGNRPRITMSWNINPQALPGAPLTLRA